MLQDKIFKLKGTVQHYAWGGTEYIPHWLGVENKEQQPFAEYWMGAHPSASSSLLVDERQQNLYSLIQNNPALFLGEEVNETFKELPYLFKILDVKNMLSIQVHPSKAAAVTGFEEEEKNGVAINASNRNYKDKNHKPEVMIALSEFWLLHGFLTEDKLLKVLHTVAAFNVFEDLVINKGYKGLFEHVMLLPQNEVDALLVPLIKTEINRKKNNELSRHDAGWWVEKLYGQEEQLTNIDRGVFSLYFFNIVKLNAGEGIFQGAGLPHAYLEGQNVELMANSDNVLRGGLTSKHIDVPELMKHIIFEGIEPDILKGVDLASGEKNYPCPVKDFGISKIKLAKDETYETKASSLEIIVVIEGELIVKGTNQLKAQRGEVVAILAGETYVISTSSKLYAYKAFVP